MHGLCFIIAVQIAIESLPISSSSHMRLAELFFGNGNSFMALLPEYFDHLLHGPTVLILLIFFRREWWQPLVLLTRGLSRGILTGHMRASTRRMLMLFIKISTLVFVCTVLPVAMLYGFIKPVLAHTAYAHSLWVVLIGLCVTMVLLLSLRMIPDDYADTRGESLNTLTSGTLTIKSALVLGGAQALSLLVHGMSRFGTTYVVARWLGFSNRRAFQVSFLIEVPLITAAFLFNGVRNLVVTPGWQLLFTWDVNLALIVSTVVAYLFLWVAWKLSERDFFCVFGLYMIVPILLVISRL